MISSVVVPDNYYVSKIGNLCMSQNRSLWWILPSCFCWYKHVPFVVVFVDN